MPPADPVPPWRISSFRRISKKKPATKTGDPVRRQPLV